MIGQGIGCGGVKAVKMLENKLLRKFIKRYFVKKHVANHQFTIACIQYVVLIHLSEQDRLIEQES